MRIFIGCSSRYTVKNKTPYDPRINVEETNKVKVIQTLLEALKVAGVTPVPWWEHAGGKPGEWTTQKIINVAKTCEGGLFLLGDLDDQSILNLFQEIGLFQTLCGIQQTNIVIDPDSGFGATNLPTNFSDFQCMFADDTLEKDISEWIGNFNVEQFKNIPFYMGEVNRDVFERKYVDWQTRGLYIGSESAKQWDAIEGGAAYGINRKSLTEFMEDAEKANEGFLSRIDNIVSFGCGNGQTDQILIEILRRSNENICYVPVDINPSLAFKAITHNKDSARIPFAIIDDFENSNDHIMEIINKKTHEIGANNLFAMIGVTFSNLEISEDRMFHMISQKMDLNDYFVLDVSLNDEREGFVENLKNELCATPFKELLINSIIRKHLDRSGNNPSGVNFKPSFIDELRERFFNFINVYTLDAELAGRHTSVSGTQVFKCDFLKNGSAGTVLISKRYDYDSIRQQIIRSNFAIVAEKSVASTERRKKAFFLLKRNN